jgi:hypothetical protein
MPDSLQIVKKADMLIAFESWFSTRFSFQRPLEHAQKKATSETPPHDIADQCGYEQSSQILAPGLSAFYYEKAKLVRFVRLSPAKVRLLPFCHVFLLAWGLNRSGQNEIVDDL